jgi:hypothetical protein
MNHYCGSEGEKIDFIHKNEYNIKYWTSPELPKLPCSVITTDRIHYIVYDSKLVLLYYYYFKPFNHIKLKADYPELLI